MSHGLEKPDQDASSEEVAAVTTRAQEKHRGKLSSNWSNIPDVSAQILNEAQQNDPTMEKLRESARAETQQQTRGKTTYRYELHTGILYHMYNSSHSGQGCQIFLFKSSIIIQIIIFKMSEWLIVWIADFFTLQHIYF